MVGQHSTGNTGVDDVRINPYIVGVTVSDRRSTMSRAHESIHEQATLSSKGQITLPKAIRQVLGVTTGAKVSFELRGSDVIVSRADAEHEDPAIGAFLQLLERDISQGKHIGKLPEALAQAMLSNLGHAVDLDETIEGDVVL
jgi:antitoxin PrlF